MYSWNLLLFPALLWTIATLQPCSCPRNVRELQPFIQQSLLFVSKKIRDQAQAHDTKIVQNYTCYKVASGSGQQYAHRFGRHQYIYVLMYHERLYVSPFCVFLTFSMASSNDLCTVRNAPIYFTASGIVCNNRAQDHTLSRNSYMYRWSFHINLAFLITQLFQGLPSYQSNCLFQVSELRTGISVHCW